MLECAEGSDAVRSWRARGRIVDVGRHRVFIVDAPGAGGRDPLVLLHGFPTSSFDFHRVIDALAEDRRVVALDLPGFGFSSKPRDYGYSLFEQAEVVEGALRRLGVVRAHLLAHDMGTSIASELLARREAGLLSFAPASVSLMNGSVHVGLARLTPSQVLLARPRLGPLLSRLANPTIFRAQMRRIVARHDAVDDALLDDLWTLVRRDDGHRRLPTIIGYMEERRRLASRWVGALRRLDLPARILWGVADPVAVMAIAARLMTDIPGATLARMEGLGHYPHLEDPARVAAEVRRFLDDVDDTATGLRRPDTPIARA